MLESTATDPNMNQTESTSEVIGLLTAISIVSRRMAWNLTLLDKQLTPERGDVQHGRTGAATEAANPGCAV